MPDEKPTSSTWVTTTRILEELRTPGADSSIWSAFTNRFRPVIVAFGRKRGLNADEAQDAAQEALLVFLRVFRRGNYDRTRGQLRRYLFGIANKRISRLLASRSKRELQIGDETNAALDKRGELKLAQKQWDEEWNRGIWEVCLGECRPFFKPQTLVAFELSLRYEWPASRISEHFGISRNAVYVSKNHILSKIRQILPDIADQFEGLQGSSAA